MIPAMQRQFRRNIQRGLSPLLSGLIIVLAIPISLFSITGIILATLFLWNLVTSTPYHLPLLNFWQVFGVLSLAVLEETIRSTRGWWMRW